MSGLVAGDISIQAMPEERGGEIRAMKEENPAPNYLLNSERSSPGVRPIPKRFLFDQLGAPYPRRCGTAAIDWFS